MSNGNQGTIIDPEDMFSDTRMSFGDHLEDLRTHLLRAIKGFALAMVFAMFVGKYAVEFITAPVQAQLEVFYNRTAAQQAKKLSEDMKQESFYAPVKQFDIEFDPDVLRAKLGLPALQRDALAQKGQEVLGSVPRAFVKLLDECDAGHLINRKRFEGESAWVVLPIQITDPRFEQDLAKSEGMVRPRTLKTFNVTEAFMVYFKVSFVVGLLIGSPWILYQIWMFVAAGLYPHEKNLVNVYLPFSVILFLAGAAMCQFLVMPKAIKFLLSFNDWMGLEPDLRLNEWLSFAIWMPVIFGASFQTPLVMVFLFKLGIADVSTFRKQRKLAWFLMAIFAVVISPSPDALSPLFLWVPMGFLYELGILMCAWQPQTPFDDVETPQTEEMVEI
jgi:sec-independent protein translocase protein TatC